MSILVINGRTTYEVSIGQVENKNYFQNDFTTKKDVENAQCYLENILRQITEQTAEDDVYSKIKKVHDWLIEFIEYDKDFISNRNRFTIYGALKDKKAVCEGYARSFKYIMDELEVPCVLVSGIASSTNGASEEHAWNYVQINEKWYAVDVTWDDPVLTGRGVITNEIKYRYFLKGSKQFFKDHREESKISENSIDFKFPELSTENYKK